MANVLHHCGDLCPLLVKHKAPQRSAPGTCCVVTAASGYCTGPSRPRLLPLLSADSAVLLPASILLYTCCQSSPLLEVGYCPVQPLLEVGYCPVQPLLEVGYCPVQPLLEVGYCPVQPLLEVGYCPVQPLLEVGYSILEVGYSIQPLLEVVTPFNPSWR